jgi:hypothetical protein
MHTALGDAENDVWALFKSSPFGSFSHSHGDQNTFQINAYGRALAIDSGYYPWYGSPHHSLWTRQTRAHNGILVNGRGQPPFNWEASGQIEHYETQGPVTVVRGQAAHAYNLPMRESVLKAWREHLKEPAPPLDPAVKSFERTVAFVASKTRPVFVVYDHVETEGPATFEWLLHALRRMEMDAKKGAVTIRNEEARLAVRLLATEPYQFAQSSKFPVAPEERAAGSPEQWHLTARTKKPAAEAKFLAVLVPYRASEKEPAIEKLEGPNATGFRVGDTEVAVWWGSKETGRIQIGDLQAEGRLTLRTSAGGEPAAVVSP